LLDGVDRPSRGHEPGRVGPDPPLAAGEDASRERAVADELDDRVRVTSSTSTASAGGGSTWATRTRTEPRERCRWRSGRPNAIDKVARRPGVNEAAASGADDAQLVAGRTHHITRVQLPSAARLGLAVEVQERPPRSRAGRAPRPRIRVGTAHSRQDSGRTYERLRVRLKVDADTPECGAVVGDFRQAACERESYGRQ
jgi:hypothetical protein